jgi:hypothetical protein
MLNCDDIALTEEYVGQRMSVSASPGFTWGRSGNVSSGAWLQNDTVPSNVTGRHIFLHNAYIKKVFISNETVNTFNIGIYEHDGTTYTLLYTSIVTGLRKFDESINIAITYNKELAMYVSSGSCKNIVCGLLIAGNLN